MSQANQVFIEQIKRDRAGNLFVLAEIEAGRMSIEFRVDAMRRLADCEAILANNA